MALIVSVIQQSCQTDKAENLKSTEQLVISAKQNGAELVVLQELHATPYFCQTEDLSCFDLAEPIPEGSTCEVLSSWAKEHELVIVGSIFEKRMAGVYHNTAVVFDKDGSFKGHYRKMHIPDDPGFYEKFYFTPGDASNEAGFKPIQTSVGNLGVLVCWDQWYPEAARLMALAGADLLIYPTAIGWDLEDTDEERQRQLNAWQTIQRSHAVANHIPVLVANRIGHEADPSQQSRGIQFWGNSFIAGPQGEVLAVADNQQQLALTANIDFKRTDFLRTIWPYFRDRRIDAYQGITQRSLQKP